MKKIAICLSVATLCLSCSPQERPSGVSLGQIRPVSFTEVTFTDAFWAPRIEVNRTVTIPAALYQSEINGRFDNFAIAGGLMAGEHRGDYPFDDTDPYKIIEGASYSLAAHYDPELDAYLDRAIELIAAAQEDDGYLTTCVTNNCTRLAGWWGTSRWEKINSHELYNSGHLYEAAVAHYKATGKRTLLDVALKNADLVCTTFGLGEGQIKYPSGHPIIEMALVKLYEVTGEQRYLDQARYFVDEAGRLSNGRKPGIYSQDHMPMMEQREIVGHAVRAGYFYSGVADVAAARQDEALFGAVRRVWENMAGRKLYLNGGVGSRGQGEGFGPEYELNNFNNYCETCASIANVYWNHRMFLATGESKYVDVLERALYNGVISGVSLSGDRFFYDNPMASDGMHRRQEWFGCACCPSNVTRFMSSVPLYTYATNGSDVFVNLYVRSDASVVIPGNIVTLSQETQYPWSGDVEIAVDPADQGRFALLLRVPGWAKGQPVPTDLYKYVDGQKNAITLSVNGEEQKIVYRGGYAEVDREWKAGDRVTLHMDMPVRRVEAHPEVGYDRGMLAMERGPILYALEGRDQPEQAWVADVVIPRDAAVSERFDAGLLGGVMILEGAATRVVADEATGGLSEVATTFTAIPYSTWNNRGQSAMTVWSPATAEYAITKPAATIATRAERVGEYGFNDGMDPSSSADLNTPYHYWWLKSGTEESVGYRFGEPTTVSGTEVYWLAFDHYDVVYRAPESWKLMWLDGTQWREVETTDAYGTELDRYNKVTFKPVETTELKMVVQLQRAAENATAERGGPQVVDAGRRGYSGGVMEWKVN